MPISGGFVRDVHPSGWLTVRGVLEESSNIGTIKVARKLGPARFYRYLRMFGFGNVTGSTLSGEVAGNVKHPSAWSSRSLESICIGQEVGATALQMAAAYGAVANGGRLMVPRILLRAVRGDSVLQAESPEAVRQVISREVAGTVVSFLEGVVAHGTGSNAQVNGYRTAGKTGTAQRVSEGGTGYDPDLYVSSFIGFLPVEQPELLGLVIVDSPQGEHYGSQVAAPVFSRMMQRILSLRDTPLRHRARPAGADGADGMVAEVARSAVDAPPAPVGPESYATQASIATDSDGPARIGAPLEMPDVVGIPLRQAISRLTSSGLQVRMRGSGTVVDQRPRPGTVVARGSVCRVICRTAG
jgi:cell division protein FtsI (penicillin-binding protein 3)